MQSCLQRATRLKKILQDTRDADGETEIRERMQLLSSQLTDTISHLHDVFSTRVFVAVCRGYWDRMGQVGHCLVFWESKRNGNLQNFWGLPIQVCAFWWFSISLDGLVIFCRFITGYTALPRDQREQQVMV